MIWIELRRCIVTFSVKTEIQRVFWIFFDETKISKKSPIQKVLKTLILHINNSKVINKLANKKFFNKKTDNLNFFQPKLICQFVRIHMNYCRFFSNFWKPCLVTNVWVVFANRFDRLSRNFLSVIAVFFAKTSYNKKNYSMNIVRIWFSPQYQWTTEKSFPSKFCNRPLTQILT